MTRKAPPKFLSNNKLYNRLNAIYVHKIVKKKYQPYYFRQGTSGDYKNHFIEKDYKNFYNDDKIYEAFHYLSIKSSFYVMFHT